MRKIGETNMTVLIWICAIAAAVAIILGVLTLLATSDFDFDVFCGAADFFKKLWFRIKPKNKEMDKYIIKRADKGDKNAQKQLDDLINKKGASKKYIDMLRREIKAEQEYEKLEQERKKKQELIRKKEAELQRIRKEKEKKIAEQRSRSVVSMVGKNEEEKRLIESGKAFALKTESTPIIDKILNGTKDYVDKYLIKNYNSGMPSCSVRIGVKEDRVYVIDEQNSFVFADNKCSNLLYEYIDGMWLVMIKKYMNYLSVHPLVKSVDKWYYLRIPQEMIKSECYCGGVSVSLKKNTGIHHWS